MGVYQGTVLMITALTSYVPAVTHALSFINAASRAGCRPRTWASIRADNVGIGHPCR